MIPSSKPWSALLAVVALAPAGCGGSNGGEGGPGPSVDRWAADTVTLEAARGVVRAVGASDLFDRVSLPYPYLTDFFGVQILKALSPEEVRYDLVPLFADVVSETPYALTLRLVTGPEVVFRFNTELYLDANRLPVHYARVELSEPSAYPRDPEAFRQILMEAGVADRYLEANPHFSAEQVAWESMLESDRLTPVAVRYDTAQFREIPHGVLLVGETHGDSEAYGIVEEMILSPDTDWFALEMFPEDLQPLLDRYLTSADGSGGWQDAREAILRFYSRNWNTRSHEVTEDPADNPYFRLLELARSSGKPVVAMDASEIYVTFRFGEFPLGAATRDYVWASKIPDWGRGVVYGGASHFAPDRRPNMLTFLRNRFPAIEIFGEPAGR